MALAKDIFFINLLALEFLLLKSIYIIYPFFSFNVAHLFWRHINLSDEYFANVPSHSVDHLHCAETS